MEETTAPNGKFRIVQPKILTRMCKIKSKKRKD